MTQKGEGAPPVVRTPRSRADLARLLAGLGEARTGAAVRLFGFEARQDEPAKVPASKIARTEKTEPTSSKSSQEEETADEAAPTTCFFRMERYEARVESVGPDPEVAPWSAPALDEAGAPSWPALMPWPRLWPRLFFALGARFDGREIDTPPVIRAWSNKEVLERLPRRPHSRWPGRVLVLRDARTPLAPIWEDQLAVEAALRSLCGHRAIEVRTLSDGLTRSEAAAIVARVRAAGRKVSVVAMTDLGARSPTEALAQAAARRWAGLGRALKNLGARRVALVPGALTMQADWHVVGWDWPRGRTRTDGDPAGRARRAERLLSLLSFAVRIEPGLLRDVRRLAGVEADVETELDAWSDPRVQASGAEGFRFLPEAPLAAWRQALLRAPEALQRALIRVVAQWHCDMPMVWRAELLILEGIGLGGLLADEVRKSAIDFGRRLGATTRDPDLLLGTRRLYAWWFMEVGRQLPPDLWRDERFERALHESEAARRELFREHALSPGADPAVLARMHGDAKLRALRVEHVAEGLVLRDAAEVGRRAASPIGTVLGRVAYATSEVWPSARGVDVQGRTPLECAPASLVSKSSYACPPWARAVGHDQYGWWAEVALGQASFRMRYILPGTFLMGSPEDEEWRIDREGPQHEVTITRGFWIAETPCTQAVWRAVTGKNPSKFKGEQRPVERVRHVDCRRFLEQLNGQVAGFDAVLPTEAQWEYACRAGTTDARYGALEEVAWYNRERGTEDVGQKAANPWGLFDTLGNVYEWCQDGRRAYGSGAVSDPVGPSDGGSSRVIRGGSWYSNARRVRAAFRGTRPPQDRDGLVGFRLARGRPSQEAEPPEVGPRPGEQAERSGAASGPVAELGWSGPPWAQAWGTDEYGVWARVQVRDVQFRLRWVPAATFLMGSPEDEPGRWGDEGPQHEVTLSKGYWLAEHPATQALWAAVRGENPSRFASKDRPVEQVSFHDVTAFLQEVNEASPGLELRLPTEAEWERACRAGTTEATYAGPMEILGERNAPILDDIAWYGGNSGVGFDLEEGWDTSHWDEQQYDHERAGTHPVGRKQPNPLGLYDMLGNVEEWCIDGWQPYGADAVTDPIAPADRGSARVVRGGSWFSIAWDVRAAYRNANHPQDRHEYVGFRLARGRTSQQDEPPEAVLRRRPGEQAERSGAATGPALWLITDRTKARIGAFERPSWASEVGRDRYGLWARVRAAPMRFRWIPPGRFQMGSPEDEPGRWTEEELKEFDWLRAEGPQHEVLLTEGYWLGEHPVTQEVWATVEDENPSRFKSARRPVEMVSFEQVSEFIEKLNAADPGLQVRLPTEAEWEHTCRAGTTEATYAGSIEILGLNNAPILEEIAWYGGNSGVEFDLENGQGADWPEKAHEFDLAGSRVVGLKRPNPWGLYDMLGNVFEWCADGPRDYDSDAVSNPVGPTDVGSCRVIRGGSWDSDARGVRAAYRDAARPRDRLGLVGFRLARGR